MIEVTYVHMCVQETLKARPVSTASQRTHNCLRLGGKRPDQKVPGVAFMHFTFVKTVVSVLAAATG